MLAGVDDHQPAMPVISEIHIRGSRVWKAQRLPVGSAVRRAKKLIAHSDQAAFVTEETNQQGSRWTSAACMAPLPVLPTIHRPPDLEARRLIGKAQSPPNCGRRKVVEDETGCGLTRLDGGGSGREGRRCRRAKVNDGGHDDDDRSRGGPRHRSPSPPGDPAWLESVHRLDNLTLAPLIRLRESTAAQPAEPTHACEVAELPTASARTRAAA